MKVRNLLFLIIAFFIGESIHASDWDLTDSLRHSEIVALALAKVRLDADLFSGESNPKSSFKKTLEFQWEDSLGASAKINVVYGNIFDDEKRHIYIRQEERHQYYFDIYQVTENDQMTSELRARDYSLTYMGDSIGDINGDHYPDFVVQGYGSAGCCLKAYNRVYLYKSETGKFSEEFEFLNPTYSPREHLVRGVCYGHAGNTDLYKYRWNGYSIDIVEYIYYETIYEEGDGDKRTGKVIRAKTRYYDDHPQVVERMDAVPQEYHHIYGYDWFTGEGYE